MLRRCGPCKYIGPIFEKLAEENPDVEFVKVDVDEADDVAAACGIRAMPTFQFFRNGAKVDESMGADENMLRSKVAKNKWVSRDRVEVVQRLVATSKY